MLARCLQEMDRLFLVMRVVRGQLNTCGALSEDGQHEAARVAALEAQECITDSLLPQAQKLVDAGNRRAAEVIRDLRVLQCAALLAQALGTQQTPEAEDEAGSAVQSDPGSKLAELEANWSRTKALASSSTQRSLYIEAKELAETFLPSVHPMVALARSFCDDSGVSAPSEDSPVLPSLTAKGNGTAPRSRTHSDSSPSSTRPRPKTPEQQVEQPVAEMPGRSASPATSQGGSSEKLARFEGDAQSGKVKNSLPQPIHDPDSLLGEEK